MQIKNIADSNSGFNKCHRTEISANAQTTSRNMTSIKFIMCWVNHLVLCIPGNIHPSHVWDWKVSNSHLKKNIYKNLLCFKLDVVSVVMNWKKRKNYVTCMKKPGGTIQIAYWLKYYF